MEGHSATELPQRGLPTWLLGLIPLVLILVAIGAFAALDGPGLGERRGPAAEEIAVERTTLTPGEIELQVRNDGPDPVSIAQVQVNDAFVQFSGAENQLGNALQHFTTDGTCSSGSPAVETIVRSPDAASALALCESLDGPETFVSASNLSHYGWNVPVDAWFCQTPLFP